MIHEKNKTNPSVGKIVGMLNNSAHIYLHHMFKEYSIGYSQGLTLHYIFQNNGISQIELTKHSNLDKGSVSSQLNILEKNGYIKRIPSEIDRRVRNIFLTDKAMKIQSSVKEIFFSWTDVLLKDFDEDKRSEIIDDLNKMLLNARNKIEEMHIYDKSK
jgi:DNA-binding MarR family transcriptional regulator